MNDLIFGGAIAGIIGGTVGIIFSHSMFIAGVTPLLQGSAHYDSCIGKSRDDYHPCHNCDYCRHNPGEVHEAAH